MVEQIHEAAKHEIAHIESDEVEYLKGEGVTKAVYNVSSAARHLVRRDELNA